MRKIKEVLRLKYDCGLSEREIARSCQISRSTVADYLMRAQAAGLGWPEAATSTAKPSLMSASFLSSEYPVRFSVHYQTASISTINCVPTASSI